MVQQTQLEFAQLCNELRGFARRDITQGIKLSKYKKSANSMLKKDPVSAHTLLGLVAGLEHDVASMHAHHARAIEVAANGFTLMYYAISLEKSCLWAESARYALMALDLHPDDSKLLDAAIEIAPLTGRFSLLKRLLSQWQTAHDGVPHPSHGHFQLVSDILARQGLLEKDLKAVLAAVGDAFCESDVILQQYRYDLVVEKEAAFIHYRFMLSDQLLASYYEDMVAARLEALACHPRIFDAFSFSVENDAVYQLYGCMERELVESADTIRVPDPDKMKLIEELIAGVEI